MAITRIMFTALLCVATWAASAQIVRPQHKKCGTTFNLQEILNNPEEARVFNSYQRLLQQRLNARRSGASITDAATIEVKIPVVFHIIDPNPNSITDDMIRLQLAILNRDYSGKNPDSANGASFYNIRGHSKITFELAKRSPRGCDTTGIVRVVSNLAVNTDVYNGNNLVLASTINQIKHAATGGSDAWESYNCHYLNIWVGTLTNGLLGIATFPHDLPQNEQGVVISKGSFSFTPGSYTFGRTLVHEVGHFLNLRHIWGDDNDEANTCLADDEVGDTPLQSVSSSGTPAGIVNDVCSPAPSKGINYQNYMDYSDDVVLTMFTNQQIERVIAGLESFPNRMKLISSKNKALVPKEGNELFTKCNTPAFTTNDFTCVGVGYKGVIWAGTANSGLYNYYGGSWHQYGSYINNLYQDIKPDLEGGIWVAQSGYNGAQAQTGGMLYFPDSIFPATPNYYSASAGLPSRYPRSILIDPAGYTVAPGGGLFPKIWTANFATVTAGISSNGGLGKGFLPTAPNFTKIQGGLMPGNITGGTASLYVVGGNSDEVWAATQNNYRKSQILRYNAYTNDTLPAYDTTNVLNGLVNGQFVTRAIYFDKASKSKWLAINGSGLIVQDSLGAWSKISFPKLFPASPLFYNNAITGDGNGNVFIGTNAGLIVYTARGAFNKDSSFTRYTIENGLPSNTIKNIAFDTTRQKLILATDAGIIFWNPTCANGVAADNETFATTATGDWSNPAIWCNGVVPPPNAKIIVRHPVTITTDTNCKSLQLYLPGSFTVAAGINFNVGN